MGGGIPQGIVPTYEAGHYLQALAGWGGGGGGNDVTLCSIIGKKNRLYTDT
jgi:hypothetical protein